MKIERYILVRFCLLVGLICLTTVADAQVNLNARVESSIGKSADFKSYESNLSSDKIYNVNVLLEMEGVIREGAKTETALILGAGLSKYTIGSSFHSPSYSISTDQDIDGDTYSREYHDLSLFQAAKGKSLAMELALRDRWMLNDRFSLFGDLGMNFMLFSNLKIDANHGNADVYGRYSQYGDVVFGGEWNNNGFGTANINGANKIDDVKLNAFIPVPVLRLGAEYKLVTANEREYRVSLGASYQYALKDMIKYTPTDGELTPENAVVYNTIALDGTSGENVRNLAGLYNKSRLKGFMINLGFSFLF